MNAMQLALKIALRNLGLRKGRAALMMAGVATGIVTLILVMAVTRGTAQKVEKGIEAFGPDAIMVFAGSPQTRGPGDERVTTLVPQDLEALRAEIPGLRVLAPMVTRHGQTLIAGDRNTTTTLFAATPEFEEAWDWHVERGEFITEAHEASLMRVAVLGRTTARELYGDDEPVGQDLRIGEQRFRVVGILQARGTSPMGGDMDNRVIVPLTTAMRRIYNVDHLSSLRLRLDAGQAMQPAVDRITALMRQRHSIGPGDTDDFGVRSPITFRQMAAKMGRTLSVLLAIITLVALGAGALVLANILTVAVAERRTEIGVRRAVGASRRQITQQFLVEGVVVTVLGGLLGIALGTAVALALQAATELPLALGWEPFVLGVVVTVAVGLLASFIPARRAASTVVVDALRP